MPITPDYLPSLAEIEILKRQIREEKGESEAQFLQRINADQRNRPRPLPRRLILPGGEPVRG